MGKYKSFKTTKQKLSKMWETSEETDSLLIAKENEVKRLLRSTEAFKHSSVIYDSDWIAITPEDENFRNTQKGALEPLSVSYDAILDDIELPDELLAFVTLDVQFKGLPGTYFMPSAQFDFHGALTDYIEVYGDGELIYKGKRTDLVSPSLNMLNAGQFLETHTKKRFYTNIGYQDDGNIYNFSGSVIGNIVRLEATYDTTQRCGTFFDSNVIECFPDMTIAAARKQDKILDIDAESFTIIGRLTENRYIDTFIEDTGTGFGGQTTFALTHNPINAGAIDYVLINGGSVGYSFTPSNSITFNSPLAGGETIEIGYHYCQFTPIVTDGVEIRLEWADLDSYEIRQVGTQLLQLINGEFEQISLGDLTFQSANVDIVGSLNFQFRNFQLYYETQTIWPFGIGDGVDVDILLDDLGGLPDTTVGHGVGETLPYSQITLNQNIGVGLFNTFHNFLISHDIHALASNQLFNIVWIKKKTLGNGFGLYKITPKIRALYFAPSTELANTSNVNVFDDTYTVVGTTYSKTSENHQTTPVKFYEPATQDIQIRVRLIFNNPLVYFKTEKNAIQNS